MRTIASSALFSTITIVSSSWVMAQSFPQQGMPQQQQPAAFPQQVGVQQTTFQQQPMAQPPLQQPVAQPQVATAPRVAAPAAPTTAQSAPATGNRPAVANASPSTSNTPAISAADGTGGTSGKNPMSAPDGIASPCSSKCLDEIDTTTFCMDEGNKALNKCLMDHLCPDIKLVIDIVIQQCARSRLGANAVGLGGNLKIKDGKNGENGRSANSKSTSLVMSLSGRFLANLALAAASVFILL